MFFECPFNLNKHLGCDIQSDDQILMVESQEPEII